MGRTSESSYGVSLFGYGVNVEEGYVDDIDTGVGVAIDGPYLALYWGKDITALHHLEDDLNFSSSVATSINKLQDVLGDYFMVGVDDTSISWQDIKLDNKTHELIVDISGAFTLFTPMKAPHIGNRDYLNFSLTKGWTFDIDWRAVYETAIIIVGVVLLCLLAALVAQVGPAAVASYAAFGFFLTQLDAIT